MKRTSCFAVCVFLSFVWISTAGAGPNKGTATQNQPPGQIQTSAEFGKIIRPRAGISWKEKVMKQREIHKRAEARRNVLLGQAEMERRKIPKEPLPPESQENP